jgi:glycosyltransferase involved in cell wall biosynthesis
MTGFNQADRKAVQMPSSQKHLAIFLPALHLGGAERTMLKLAGGFARRGVRVDFVLARAEGPHLAEVPRSVRVVDLQASRTITCLPALVQYLRWERPDALLSGLVSNPLAVWARCLSGVRTRVVVSERDTLSSEMRFYASDPRMWLIPRLVRWFYPRADGIVAVSKAVADDLSQVTSIPRQRIQVIYNPVITPDLSAQILADLDHPWFGPGQPPVILSVGRLAEQKDFATLIKAFALVRRHHAARLLILGEGEQRPELENLVQELNLLEDVSLPGFVANPYPYMRHAAVFVLSSRWEGLPGVLIEALYSGSSLISTDCPGGSREILADGRIGQLIPVGDADLMAAAIERSLQHGTPRPSRDDWRAYELEHVVDQYNEVLFTD